MNNLVSRAQSALIKTRTVPEYLLFIKNLTKSFHKCKTMLILFKLDIHKAFDSIRWDYILDLIQHRGFLSRFHNWIVTLISTFSSRVLLNGVADIPIMHVCVASPRRHHLPTPCSLCHWQTNSNPRSRHTPRPTSHASWSGYHIENIYLCKESKTFHPPRKELVE